MKTTIENNSRPPLMIARNYFQRFYEIKGDNLSDKAAYLLLEEEYREQYEVNKYTSYGSFRVMKGRFVAKMCRK